MPRIMYAPKKRVLILSESSDYSTNQVLDCLHEMSVECIRINHEDITNLVGNIDLQKESPDLIFSLKKQQYNIIKDFSAIWFRRTTFAPQRLSIVAAEDLPSAAQFALKQYLFNEQLFFSQTVHRLILRHANFVLGNPFVFQANRLWTQQKAKDIGFSVPKSVVLNNKAGLQEFYKKRNEQIICKGLQEAFSLELSDTMLHSYTSCLSEKDIDLLPEYFAPSLFQEKIDKEFEIRIFYLMKSCYAMAIFSQNDPQTQIDFRKYNKDKPNRCVPFSLPQTIENMLQMLMTSLDLNTGSIDLIFTKNKEFVFLEVNPVGQYDFVSKYCNYQLDQKIAHLLYEQSIK